MAQRTIVQLTDDIDGSEATRTIDFAFYGTSYEIDLNDKNFKKFDEAIRPYMEKARKTSGRRSSGRSTSSASKQDLGAIREWARANGHKVSERGRISQEVQDAYKAAH
ncbi:histone-like nucleoid-structuring protein Lsr2 [Pedococcus soli]